MRNYNASLISDSVRRASPASSFGPVGKLGGKSRAQFGGRLPAPAHASPPAVFSSSSAERRVCSLLSQASVMALFARQATAAPAINTAHRSPPAVGSILVCAGPLFSS